MRSVGELSAEANDYVFSASVSFRNWIHVSKSLLREARVYALEDRNEMAYVLYLRYADLILNRLCKHPALKDNKKAYDDAVKLIPSVLADAEKIKQKLLARKPEPKPAPKPAAVPTAPKPGLDTSQRDVATAPPASALVDAPASTKAATPIHDSMLETLRSLKPHRPDTASSPGHHHNWLKPFEKHVVDYSSLKATPSPVNYPQHFGQAPKPVDINTEHRVTAALESGAPLRTVFFPTSLQQKFLAVAQHNTAMSLETCGILCGKLNRNAFFITDLVIPHQISTSDTCSTTHEEILFDYVDKRDLFILGWIHTHPTQSCFLSSVDLHTQDSYQIMLPEAIAAVCSPRHDPSFGIFRLTDPPGVQIIKRCTLTGFHPHDEQSLYRHALPGHVRLADFEFTTCDLRQIKAD